MKRRSRIVAIVLATIMLLCVFSLTACTDKTTPTRELDEVERSIVGTWSDGDDNFFFMSNGTYRINNSTALHFEFKHSGYGLDNGNRYEKIVSSYNNYALFDNEPNRLYRMDNLTIRYHIYLERV